MPRILDGAYHLSPSSTFEIDFLRPTFQKELRSRALWLQPHASKKPLERRHNTLHTIGKDEALAEFQLLELQESPWV